MLDQITKYSNKLIRDRTVAPASAAFAVQDDSCISSGPPTLQKTAVSILSRLNALALVVAPPLLPFADNLIKRLAPDDHSIIPRDTETRTFLHDIPLLRSHEIVDAPDERMAELLSHRKGILVEGVGIIAVGALTVEQAYINYSSVFHAVFVKYLEDLLNDGFQLPGEEASLRWFQQQWLRPLTSAGLQFNPGPLLSTADILREMTTVGGYTVERGLVDSFFGNISCRAGTTVYISQTAASLDELAGCIDPVPFDNSSTAGITASSELAAHRRIYELSDAAVILHGHPKFAVIMSMLCDETSCTTVDCWKECPVVRYLGETPIVAGEIGAGGLARKVPPVIAESGEAIVYGHGVFTIGRSGFAEAFERMVSIENRCRESYFSRLAHRSL